MKFTSPNQFDETFALPESPFEQRLVRSAVASGVHGSKRWVRGLESLEELGFPKVESIGEPDHEGWHPVKWSFLHPKDAALPLSQKRLRTQYICGRARLSDSFRVDLEVFEVEADGWRIRDAIGGPFVEIFQP